jgi:tRNA pseudouridine38-40 synthase
LYRYAWRVQQTLDVDAMKNAMDFLKGRQDFSAFRASGCSSKNPIRMIFYLSIELSDFIHFMGIGLSGRFIKIRIEADAFLRHMVRNIVGTIVEVGKGKINAVNVREIILSKDRNLAGPTAPARGLFLEKINY